MGKFTLFDFWLVKKLAVLHMWNWYLLTFPTLAMPVIWCNKISWEHYVTQPYKIHLKPPKWVNLPSNSRCCHMATKLAILQQATLHPLTSFLLTSWRAFEVVFADPNAGKHDNQYSTEKTENVYNVAWSDVMRVKCPTPPKACTKCGAKSAKKPY